MAQEESQRPVILVADDESESAELLGVILGLEFPDAIVLVANGGQAALDLAHQKQPHVAVLDLEMPGLDGEKLAFALRAAVVPPPLLVVVSGNLTRMATMQGNGAFDHQMSKPVDVTGLARLLAASGALNLSPP